MNLIGNKCTLIIIFTYIHGVLCRMNLQYKHSTAHTRHMLTCTCVHACEVGEKATVCTAGTSHSMYCMYELQILCIIIYTRGTCSINCGVQHAIT